MTDEELFESWLEHANEQTLINALKDYRKIVFDLKSKIKELELDNIDNRIMNKSQVDWVFRHTTDYVEQSDDEEIEIDVEVLTEALLGEV
tara:strand:- start:2721 stop:2990 length:270 start_codon:yes stop_codon:yes gene_type:complete